MGYAPGRMTSNPVSITGIFKAGAAILLCAGLLAVLIVAIRG